VIQRKINVKLISLFAVNGRLNFSGLQRANFRLRILCFCSNSSAARIATFFSRGVVFMVDRIGLGEFAGRRFSRKRKLNPRCVVAGEQLYSLRGKGRARLTFCCALLFGDHFRHYNASE
jgi:hypothetical protein